MTDEPTGRDEHRKPEVVLHEQRLEPGTRRVPVERIVVRRRITTMTRRIDVSVRREELEVLRLPLTDHEDAGDGLQAPPLVLVLSEEEPVVTLRTRPYEQVTVRVDRVTGHQQVTQPLSREQVEVLTESGTDL